MPDVVLGLVAAPGAAQDLSATMAADLPAALSARLPGVRWRIEQVTDGLVAPPAEDVEIIDAARRLLLARGWDLVVHLTDLPLRAGRRPVVAHASAVHAVAVLSVPALGVVGLRRRAQATVLALLEGLLGEPVPGVTTARPQGQRDHGRSRRLRRRVIQLGADADTDAAVLRFTARVLTGNLRLLVGMVRANRPWRLAAGLSRALAAAVATGVLALITSDVWRLAYSLGAVRLSALALVSVAAIAATLITGAGLWEHTQHPRMREQVVLFNLATTTTVVIGVLVLYAVLLVLSVLGALLLVVPTSLSESVGHQIGLGDYVRLAWLTSSLATVGGALGAGLETDEAVRQAAYTHRTNAATHQDFA